MIVNYFFKAPDEMQKMFRQMTQQEREKLLVCVGWKLVSREKLFHKKFRSRQNEWPEPSREYAARKRLRMHGGREKWVATGEAKRSLTRTDEALTMRLKQRGRGLNIFLRKMVKGVNVYAVVQDGRFGGLKVGDKSLNKDESVRYRAGRLLGGKTGEKATRISVKPMPITTYENSDESVVMGLVREEFAITLKYRGLQ